LQLADAGLTRSDSWTEISGRGIPAFCPRPMSVDLLGVFQLRQGTEEALRALTVMTNEDTVCWQCGAPAEPGCAYTQGLVNRNPYPDGLGVPVKRGARGLNVVRVTVPRCEACQLRNYLCAFLSFTGFLVGACIGGLQFQSKGITTIIGGFLGLIPALLVCLYYRRILGLRSIDDYPLLKRLRAAGWEEPG
jgi:hypothetical protein